MARAGGLRPGLPGRAPGALRSIARLAAVALALGVSCGASGEEPKKKGAAYAPAQAVLSWEITLGGAGGFGVAKDDIERAFANAGYTGTSASSDFLSATFYPAIRYRVRDNLLVGVSASSTKLGSTTGSTSGTTVSIQRSSEDVALVAFWRPFSGFRIGAGPAWFRLTASPSGSDDLVVSKLGWIAEVGFAGPDSSRVYGDLGVQYRGTGSADFGTYQPPAKIRAAPSIDLDGIGCNHWALVVGIGFRF